LHKFTAIFKFFPVNLNVWMKKIYDMGVFKLGAKKENEKNINF